MTFLGAPAPSPAWDVGSRGAHGQLGSQFELVNKAGVEKRAIMVCGSVVARVDSLAVFPGRRGWSKWRDGPARAPVLPGVLICHDGLCGFLLGSRAPCGECRDPTWFVAMSFLGCRRDLPHREGVRLLPSGFRTRRGGLVIEGRRALTR